jgi:hypothetical protein
VDEPEQSYRVFKQRQPVYWITVPLVTLLVVVGVVCGLVFGGVIKGDEIRVSPEHAPTTQSTVQIAP